jgi:DNA repair protein RecN (Recombination protein N)
MIERLLIKDYLHFNTLCLDFEPGLIAFTGASGAGKSVLMRAFLALFGLDECDAKLIEVALDAPLALEEIGVEAQEPNILRCVKQKSARYFINDQMISRKNMALTCKDAVRYLSVKEGDELSSNSLLELLDASIKDDNFAQKRANFSLLFYEYNTAKSALESIEAEEKRVEELKEFARFEIQKIEEINPRIGEDEELMQTKKMLSKKEKFESALNRANMIFETESAVHEALHLGEIESDFFDACMNELRMHLENASSRLADLEEADIEGVLDRIEKISTLKNRFGSIEEIHIHLQKRRQELAHYENIAFEKKEILAKYQALKTQIDIKAQEISKARKEALPSLEEKINSLLSALYLENALLHVKDSNLSETGKDSLHVSLANVDIKLISSGERNRLRLAFIATAQALGKGDGGVLILDEVDANLSGKESMSVANVLSKLAQDYQIFAISHQPQLSSQANQHFLVEKRGDAGVVRLLNHEERVLELARMVSGENITPEAKELALSLMKEG